LLAIALAGFCLSLPGSLDLIMLSLETISRLFFRLMPESGNPDTKASDNSGHQANQSGPEGVKHG
jgi:hypothetical protein